MVTLYGEDIAQQIAQYAETAGIAHIVVGNTMGLRSLALGREGLANRLMRQVHGAVVNVVPVRDLPAQYGRLREAAGLRPTMGDLWKALAAVAIATALGMGVYAIGLSSSVILMLYLLVVLFLATKADGFFYGLIASLGCMLAYNFFFTTPRFTFNAYGLNYPFIFGFLLLGTLAASLLLLAGICLAAWVASGQATWMPSLNNLVFTLIPIVIMLLTCILVPEPYYYEDEEAA